MQSLQEDLGYSYKRLHKVTRESITERTKEKLFEYLATCKDKDPRTLHFFVIKTTRNKNYGHSVLGTEAYEVQRYASNATLTINLLHSIAGIQYVNILLGPSNGNELLHCFAEVEKLNEVDILGNSILNVGDTIVMDNCSFSPCDYNRTGSTQNVE